MKKTVCLQIVPNTAEQLTNPIFSIEDKDYPSSRNASEIT